MRRLSGLDQLLIQLDQLLSPKAKKTRANPSLALSEPPLSPKEIEHVIGLMRVNHAGEIAAQGLYQGQALTAKLEDTREHMNEAAQEEIDHLAWCRERIEELGGRTSYLDPFWYAGSFAIGALAGLAGDEWSLGFIAETEHQVSEHLKNHLDQVPSGDYKTQKILEVMKHDEEHHAQEALDAGAKTLPKGIRLLMKCASQVMVKTAYYF